MPVLAPGSATLRVLHISDLHMMPNQKLKQNWLRELDRLDPDLVVNTGDNLSHMKSVPAVVQSMGGLLARPGLFVFGSNDYFAPKPKNPMKYFKKEHRRVLGAPLPWADLRRRSPSAVGSTSRTCTANSRSPACGSTRPASTTRT